MRFGLQFDLGINATAACSCEHVRLLILVKMGVCLNSAFHGLREQSSEKVGRGRRLHLLVNEA
jgi:hypothetical protein